MSEQHEPGYFRIDGEDSHGTTIYDGSADVAHSSSDSGVAPYAAGHRFERVVRLLGRDSMEFLAGRHVIVFGVGGVGSFTAESLIRSGIGRLTIVDHDRVCETNINRQLPALETTVGEFKVDVLVERFSKINPAAKIVGERTVYYAGTSERLLNSVDYVVDAIDNVPAKAHLIATCIQRKIPIVSSMGAGGKINPSRVQIADISKTHSDRLARVVRRILRQDYGIDTTKHIGVPSVFSDEPASSPMRLPGDPEDNLPLPHGTLSFVTGVFGLTAASVVVRNLLNMHRKEKERGK